MNKPYHRVDPFLKGQQIDWCETYDMLVGPDNFECLLTEPEDRTWWRDGRTVVNKLNEQHAAIIKLTEERDALSHVIIEGGIEPGISYSCRCEQCRTVAIDMNEVGYLNHIHSFDRWWEDQ